MKKDKLIKDLIKYWEMYGDVNGYRCSDRWEREIRRIVKWAKELEYNK